PHPMPGRVADGREILVEGPKFVLERWEGGPRTLNLPDGTTGWLIPLRGEGVVDGVAFRAGECVTLQGSANLHAEAGSDLLFAYPGETRL
ncbi:phosphoheptose isomerase, partial [Escherichia coli]|nr:phosphoheptose isomerase [Escherichia coli]